MVDSAPATLLPVQPPNTASVNGTSAMPLIFVDPEWWSQTVSHTAYIDGSLLSGGEVLQSPAAGQYVLVLNPDTAATPASLQQPGTKTVTIANVGTYPDVTGSQTITAGIAVTDGVNPTSIQHMTVQPFMRIPMETLLLLLYVISIKTSAVRGQFKRRNTRQYHGNKQWYYHQRSIYHQQSRSRDSKRWYWSKYGYLFQRDCELYG